MVGREKERERESRENDQVTPLVMTLFTRFHFLFLLPFIHSVPFLFTRLFLAFFIRGRSSNQLLQDRHYSLAMAIRVQGSMQVTTTSLNINCTLHEPSVVTILLSFAQVSDSYNAWLILYSELTSEVLWKTSVEYHANLKGNIYLWREIKCVYVQHRFFPELTDSWTVMYKFVE